MRIRTLFMKCPILALIFSFTSSLSYAGSSSALESKFQDIMARSSSHSSLVNSLLAKPPVKKRNLNLPVVSSPPPDAPDSDTQLLDVPYIPVPEFDETIDIYRPNYETEVLDAAALPSPPAALPMESNPTQSTMEETIIKDSYNELDEDDFEQRGKGYYFGPLVGIFLPKDGSIRDGTNLNPYEAENGYLLGLNLGKDFGAVSVEGEYTYYGANGSGGISIGVNNLFSRIILEKEIGDAIDLRTGLGIGLAFVSIDGGGFGEPSDVGFAYDFLVGLGYNFSESLALNFEYKYYLTAANERYDRIAAHCILLSANFLL